MKLPIDHLRSRGYLTCTKDGWIPCIIGLVRLVGFAQTAAELTIRNHHSIQCSIRENNLACYCLIEMWPAKILVIYMTPKASNAVKNDPNFALETTPRYM